MSEDKRFIESIILLKAEYIKATEQAKKHFQEYKFDELIKISYEVCLGYRLTTLEVAFPTKELLKKWLKKIK